MTIDYTIRTKRLRKNGRLLYRARLTFARDPITGIRPAGCDRWHEKEREAVAACKRFTEQKPGTDKITVLHQFIKDEFLPIQEALYNNGELSWQRYYNRKNRLTRFIINGEANIRNVSLAYLRPAMMETFFTDLLVKQRTSAETRNLLRQDLILALKVAKHRIPEPVAAYFEDIPLAKVQKRTKQVFDGVDIVRIINDDSKPLWARSMVAFEFIMQCRPSEMFALEWRDIDWRSNTITLNKAMRRERDGFKVSEHTKNGERSDRTVAMEPPLPALLRALHKQRVKEGRTEGLVFLSVRGSPLNGHLFKNNVWPKVKAALGLPDGPTFYSLKTAGNTYFLQHGYSLTETADRMGHTTTRMAEQVYRQKRVERIPIRNICLPAAAAGAQGPR